MPSPLMSALMIVSAVGAGVLVGWLAGLARGRAGIARTVIEAERRRHAQTEAGAAREAALREELVSLRGASSTEAQLRAQSQGDAVLSMLSEYSARLGTLEQQRQRESAVLEHAVGELRRSNEEIRTEARRLAAALSDSRVRGSWGEVQLRRVLELSGLLAHVDFVEQVHLAGEHGSLRPDVVVRLPNGRCVVIDAKAPLDAYLRSTQTEDDAERRDWLGRHAAAVASHVSALGRRSYERHAPGAVDFVVMFVPGDAFLSAAFDSRPDLLEVAARQNVILASPSTLLAFLRGVACGWRERQVADEAEAVAALGRELHERLAVFSGHLGSLGAALGRAVGSYNTAVGSFERRVAVTARRFDELGAGSGRDIAGPVLLEHQPVPPTEVA